MHIHILGICGTFMGGLAVLATQLGYKVTGSDQNVYPPMSTQLEQIGVSIHSGYDSEPLSANPDIVIVGNVMKRGMPIIESILDLGIPYLSGPEWLAKEVLAGKHVIAVSGTHGKTTTTSMIAWILDYAKLNPGFLIGGVPNNFGLSARLGEHPYFVIEADEYDCAFFDKRSKFVHYHPRTLVINNIEYDHADIFPNIQAIQQQFHHLVRTVPGQGLIISPDQDQYINEVLKMGCWSKQEKTAINGTANNLWSVKNASVSRDEFEVYYAGTLCGKIQWSLLGEHNLMNALSAIAAANHVGVSPAIAIQALNEFKSVKRRLELKGIVSGVHIYDDFAHHPTAIETTLAGLRAKVGNNNRIIAVLDIRSNTMKAGVHQNELSSSVEKANLAYFYKTPEITWDVEQVWKNSSKSGGVFTDLQKLTESLKSILTAGDHLVFMSNGGFGGIHNQFLPRT